MSILSNCGLDRPLKDEIIGFLYQNYRFFPHHCDYSIGWEFNDYLKQDEIEKYITWNRDKNGIYTIDVKSCHVKLKPHLSEEEIGWYKDELDARVEDSINGAPYKLPSLTTNDFKWGHINGSFDVSNTDSLLTLIGGPTSIDGYYDCSNCKNLDSLEGLASHIEKGLNCYWCKHSFGEVLEKYWDYDCTKYLRY